MNYLAAEKKEARLAEKAALQQRTSFVEAATAAVTAPSSKVTRRRGRGNEPSGRGDEPPYFEYDQLDHDSAAQRQQRAVNVAVGEAVRSVVAKRKSHKSLHESIAEGRRNKQQSQREDD
jgi:hypothetical protein